MPVFLRQSTASQEVLLGPFVDSTDGTTAETGLTIANTDIQIWKAGGTTEGNKNSGGATHIAGGRYYAVLDATDTNTIGPMRLSVQVAGALAVWLECCVLDEAVYDVLFGTTAPSTYAGADTSGTTTLLGRIGSALTITSGRVNADVTHIATAAVSTSTAQLGVNVVNVGGSAVSASAGLLNANVTQISGDSVAADNAEAFFDGTGYAGTNNVIPTVTSVTNRVTANADQFGGATVTATTSVTFPAASTVATTTGAVGSVTGAVGSVTGAVGSVTGNVGGNVTGSVGSVAAGGITASSLAADAITAAKVAADVGTEIGTAVWASGTRTLTGGVTVAGYATGQGPASLLYQNPSELLDTEAANAFAQAYGTGTLTADLAGNVTGRVLGGGAGTITGIGAWAAGASGAAVSTLDAAGVRTAVGLASANLDTQLGTIDTVADAILADTGTDGVVLSTATCQKIAHVLLRRTMTNVEASSDGDTLDLSSLYGLIQMAQEASVSGTTLTVKRVDGSTTLGTKTLTATAGADPITAIQ